MVNHTKAADVEKKVLKLLRASERLSKYDLDLHTVNNYGIDIEPTVKRYRGLAIEVENTETVWPDDAPYPPSWKKGFTVPSRKLKFYKSHPLSIYIKVNSNFTRAVVAPMTFVCAADTIYNRNREEMNFRDNDFFIVKDPNHPGICYCSIEDLPEVVAAQLEVLYRLSNANNKYTGTRPNFINK